MPKKEGGLPQSQREDDGEGAPPEQRAHLAHGMHGHGYPSPRTTSTQRGLPKQHAPKAHGVQGGREGNGAGPQPEGEGGPPPEHPRTPFVRGLNQEMGGHPQDLLRTTPPPMQDKAEGRGAEQGIQLVRETVGTHLPH